VVPPRGWAEEVSSNFNKTSETLLAKSPDESGMRASFFERYHAARPDRLAQSARLARRVQKRATDSRRLVRGNYESCSRRCSPASARSDVRSTIYRAVRASTREELWRRVSRARDYLHAHLAAPVSLSEVAAAACPPLARHCFVCFRPCFTKRRIGILNNCRLDRAKFLLEKRGYQ